jgi:PRC-barrel domain protein
MGLPLPFRLASAALAIVLAVGEALPQSPQPRPAGKARKAAGQVVGLPIVTSDGKAIGKVIATGTDEDNQPVLVAEIEQQLGIGPEAIAIPPDLFVRKPGHIELTITEAEVNARLGR